MATQATFKARPSDLLLITQPKSGTTWLKALMFSILTRTTFPPSLFHHHPLLSSHPHDLFPFLDFFYLNQSLLPDHTLDALPSPRLLALHLPYSSLPDSVIESGCRIVYLARDPKDTLVSLCHFIDGMRPNSTDPPLPFDEAFELFCGGSSPYGPVWDHHIGYWSESVKRPEKVLFLKYEEVKEDTKGSVKRLAEFMGCRFEEEEEEEGGVVEEIVRLCSFEKLSGLEVNKTGPEALKRVNAKTPSYFRKGEVGDWKNHMSLEMARRLDGITEEKLQGSGLSFR